MSYLMLLLHLVLCLFLIILVLIQHGKGADAGALMGSGAETFLGAGTAGNAISRLTTIIAIAFMATSIILVVSARSSMSNVESGEIQNFDPLKGSVANDFVPPQPQATVAANSEANSAANNVEKTTAESDATAENNEETVTDEVKSESEASAEEAAK